jgi:hypothetical protein
MHRLDRGRGPPENRESRPADTGAALESPFSYTQLNTTKARRRQARVQVRASNSLIKAFVDCMFKHADAGTYVMLRAFRDDNKTYGSWRPIKLTEGGRKDLAWAAFKAAEDCAGGDPGRPVFCPPIATFKSPYGNRANTANLANGLVLTVDCDTASPAAVAKLSTLLGAPTLTVASGGKWTDDAGAEHDKLHLHWRLNTPTRTPEEHELLRQARVLAAHIARAETYPLGRPYTRYAGLVAFIARARIDSAG